MKCPLGLQVSCGDVLEPNKSVDTSTWARRAGEWLPMVLLALSIIANTQMASTIHKLNSQRVSFSSIQVGEKMPFIEVADLNGATDNLHWTNRAKDTVLYVFTPQCIWCQKNIDNILFLQKTEVNTTDFIGLSLTDKGFSDYVSKKPHLTNTVLLSNGTKDPTFSSFRETPETVLVSKDGIVKKIWYGAYTGATEEEIEAFFMIKLPGLER